MFSFSGVFENCPKMGKAWRVMYTVIFAAIITDSTQKYFMDDEKIVNF